MRTLLVILILGFLAHQGRSQCNNNRQCSECSNPTPGSCCVLEDGNRALGFSLFTLPGTESGLLNPCIRIEYPASAIGRSNYIVVAGEPSGTVCIRKSSTATSQAGTATCTSGAVFFCDSVNLGGNDFVDLDILCQPIGTSCESSDLTFPIRAAIFTFDNDVEDFCDVNGTLPLPSSLAVRTDIPNMENTRMPVTEGGAVPLQSLPLVALTLIAALATSWVWSH